MFSGGCYLGAVFLPNYTTRGTTGFYLVPFSGAEADFLVLMTVWVIIIAVVRWFRAEKPTHPAMIGSFISFGNQLFEQNPSPGILSA